MKKLHFKSASEFESLFSSKNRKITDLLVEGIRNAMNNNKKVAKCFNISFDDSEYQYEISLNSKYWPDVLQDCLDFYHSQNETDLAIDTWELLECAKVW